MTAASATIPPRRPAAFPPRDAVGPLSFQQEEMVDVLLTHRDCAQGYDLPLLFDLHGALAADCLSGALRDVAQRQAVLRTTIEACETGYRQRVHHDLLPDLAPVAVDGDVGRAVATLIDCRLTGEDVVAGAPLFRAELFQIEPTRHLLALSLHHLVYDGQSFSVLWRELSECYSARIAGRAPDLPPLRWSYLDYARREHADWPAVAERSLPFWGRLLEGAPQEIAWPDAGGDGPPYAVRDVRVSAPTDSAAAIRNAAQASHVSPFLVLLAATAAGMARVTGTRDLLLGTDFSNRDPRLAADLVGHFLNTRLSRAVTEPGEPLPDLIARLRHGWFAAAAHCDCYLGQALRRLGRPPPTMVIMEPPESIGHPDLDGLAVTEIPVEPERPYWRDLMVAWHASAAGYEATITYRPSRVSDATAAALSDAIVAVLARPSSPYDG